MKLFRLIYSSYHAGVSTKAVDEILTKSRENNRRDGITGALVHSNEDFMQLLEGDRLMVTQCFIRITRDPLHQDIQMIFAEDVSGRLFESWDMYGISASRICKSDLAKSLVTGTFNPYGMSSARGVDIYKNLSLSAGGLGAVAQRNRYISGATRATGDEFRSNCVD